MVKITELDPPPSPLTGGEQVPIVQGGEMYIAGLGELMESVAQPFVDVRPSSSPWRRLLPGRP